MRTFPRFPPHDDGYDFNPESPNPIPPQEGSRSDNLPAAPAGHGPRSRPSLSDS